MSDFNNVGLAFDTCLIFSENSVHVNGGKTSVNPIFLAQLIPEVTFNVDRTRH